MTDVFRTTIRIYRENWKRIFATLLLIYILPVLVINMYLNLLFSEGWEHVFDDTNVYYNWFLHFSLLYYVLHGFAQPIGYMYIAKTVYSKLHGSDASSKSQTITSKQYAKVYITSLLWVAIILGLSILTLIINTIIYLTTKSLDPAFALLCFSGVLLIFVFYPIFLFINAMLYCESYFNKVYMFSAVRSVFRLLRGRFFATMFRVFLVWFIISTINTILEAAIGAAVYSIAKNVPMIAIKTVVQCALEIYIRGFAIIAVFLIYFKQQGLLDQIKLEPDYENNPRDIYSPAGNP